MTADRSRTPHRAGGELAATRAVSIHTAGAAGAAADHYESAAGGRSAYLFTDLYIVISQGSVLTLTLSYGRYIYVHVDSGQLQEQVYGPAVRCDSGADLRRDPSARVYDDSGSGLGRVFAVGHSAGRLHGAATAAANSLLQEGR